MANLLDGIFAVNDSDMRGSIIDNLLTDYPQTDILNIEATANRLMIDLCLDEPEEQTLLAYMKHIPGTFGTEIRID